MAEAALAGLARQFHDAVSRLRGVTAGDDAVEPDTVLLGRHYAAHSTTFHQDWTSRPWLSYRARFPLLGAFVSDTGWGCMLRSGQMLLASALAGFHVGRDWRRAASSGPDAALMASILADFLDHFAAPYSIHQLCLIGCQLNKPIGHWFGPNTVSDAIRHAVNSHPASTLRVLTCDDAVIYRSDVIVSTSSTTNADFNAESIKIGTADNIDKTPPAVWKPTLILIPLRLGIDNLNPIYHDPLRLCFHLPQCVGIAGGRPNSSLFFLGYTGDQLLYMDPHITRPAVPIKPEYSLSDFDSYFSLDPQFLPLSSLDPSLVIGFLCKTVDDFESLCQDTSGLTSGKAILFSIAEHRPSYAELGLEGDVMSDDFFEADAD